MLRDEIAQAAPDTKSAHLLGVAACAAQSTSGRTEHSPVTVNNIDLQESKVHSCTTICMVTYKQTAIKEGASTDLIVSDISHRLLEPLCWVILVSSIVRCVLWTEIRRQEG